MRPEIKDNDETEISIELNGVKKQVWEYSNEQERREKMRQAHYWCDGFACASGVLSKKTEKG